MGFLNLTQMKMHLELTGLLYRHIPANVNASKHFVHDCVCGSPHMHVFMGVSLSCVMLYYPPCTGNPIRITQQANRGSNGPNYMYLGER